MKSIAIQKQDIIDTAAPEVSDQWTRAVLEDAPGCEAIGSVFPDYKQQYQAVLNHQFQLTGLLSPDGRLIVVNRVALAFGGINESEILGRWFWETPGWTHSTEVQDRLRASIQKAAAGEPVRFETTHLDKDGNVRNIDFSLSPVFDDKGDVIYLVPEGHDITDAKEREAALMESEERCRILLETASDAIFMMKRDTFVECNQKMLDILECNREQVIGHSILEFSPPEQDGRVDSEKMMMKKIGAALEGESQNFDWTYLKYGGTSFAAEICFNRIGLSTGPHIQGRLKDVTERNRFEEERKSLQERLQQSQKMEAIGTLAAGIAHDFNNILAPIVGYAELSMSHVGESAPIHSFQKQIIEAAMRAKDLIKQVLAFSRKGDEVIKPVQVKIILQETLKLIRASLPSNIDIVETIDSDGSVLSSPTHIQQVVMNLCTNASHAMKETGGLLQIRLVEENISEDVAGGYIDLPAGHYLKLVVSDTGYGIAPGIMKSIFNPYFTTKKKGEGTGLGLSMVHGIVKDRGGEILVESEPGKGSIFSVYLPAALKKEKEERRSAFETPGGSEKILVVDDEKPILQMLNRYLERLGYTVTTRVSSVEALEAFKGNPDDFDLVITDMTMPHMTGDKLAKEIKKCRSDIPIILSTGYGDRMPGKNAGVDAVLMKPIPMSDLAVTIRNLLDDGRSGNSPDRRE